MVHVFWAERIDEATNYTNAIMYTRWNGQTWSLAHDVLLSPQGASGRAEVPAVAYGKGGELYVVFSGGWGGTVYFSSVRVPEADQASAWLKPEELNESIAGADEPRIAVGSEGTLHVVFRVPTGGEQGVYYTQSEDNGRTWTRPRRIPGSQLGGDAALFDTRVAVDLNGTLHAVWSWAGFPDTFPPKGVLYAKSTDKGKSWSLPVVLAAGPFRNPDIVVQANGEVHLFWSGTGEQRYKFHRSSSDGGITWSQPWTFSSLGGLQGTTGAAEDSSGVLHLMMATNIVGEGPEVLVHTQRSGQQWSEPEIVLRDTHGYNIIGEDLVSPAIVVTEGNILHVVVQYPVVRVPKTDQQRDIFYIRGRASAPHVQPKAVPTVTLGPTPTPEMIKVVSPVASPSLSGSGVLAEEVASATRPARTESGAQNVLAVGAGSAIFVLLVVVLAQQRRR